ncbi:MAG: AAA family ATPase [Verrucomicrobiota bacterium]
MKRDIHPLLEGMLRDDRQREVILVEGARQVGKSTLVSHVLAGMDAPSTAIDLEKDRKTARLIDKTADFADFRVLMKDHCGLREDGGILFLDEAQECPVLARYVKSFKEDWPGVRVVLTGSSMHRLFGKDIRIPVGRTRSLCVFPFSFPEFLRCLGDTELAETIHAAPGSLPPSRHEHLLGLYNRYLHAGGYPEAIKALAAGEAAEPVIDEIIGTLQDDFGRKEDYGPALFEDTIRAVANHVGNPSKYTHLDTTKYHAKKIISAMRAWHLILEVRPHALDPQHSDFLPKRYLHDLGVVNRQRSMAVPSISLLRTLDPQLRTPLGGLFENAVLLNLLEGASAKMKVGTWRKGTRSAVEVDFVMDAAELGLKIPIECKATLAVRRRHAGSVVDYLRTTHQPFGVLVSAAPLGVVYRGDGCCVMNIPAYLATRNNIVRYAEGA